MFFLPQETLPRTLAKRMFEVIIRRNGLKLPRMEKSADEPGNSGTGGEGLHAGNQQAFIERPKDCREASILTGVCTS
jgi:glutamate synthase (NADPH/NADH) large chain